MIGGDSNQTSEPASQEPAKKREAIVTKELVTAIERTIGVLTAVSAIAGFVFWHFELFPSVVCCWGITVCCAVYIAYLNFAHNVSKRPAIELFPAGIYSVIIMVLLNSISTDVIIHFNKTFLPPLQSHNEILKLDPNKLYQNDQPVASFANQGWQANMNIYYFSDVNIFGKADMSDTFQFRDWNLLCEINTNTGKPDRKDLMCKVESKR